ncbi:Disintegrin and metalloproteinase domain-containing protein [Branchiostoma belcheri]|nr:Disintegrin and metalloproteinase domain-containing protein [Branchiostoma belcheri]
MMTSGWRFRRKSSSSSSSSLDVECSQVYILDYPSRVVATCSNTCSTPRAHVVITCARHFNLRLKRDTSIFSPNFKLETEHGEEDYDTSHIYSGGLYGELSFAILLGTIVPVARCSRRINHTQTLQAIASRTNFYRLSFFPRTIREWNELEPGAVEAGSLAQFKFELARTLLH